MEKKSIPVLKTDEEARQFVETADFTEYDLSAFKATRFVERKPPQKAARRLVSKKAQASG